MTNASLDAAASARGTITIIHTSVEARARDLACEGFEPVECSLGGCSILGALAMDHHGEESWREGVALRAYRDHFGARRADPRFVVTGAADADATFAIAALLGWLPHPSRAAEFEKAPPWLRAAWTRGVSGLAEVVNRVDCDPFTGAPLAESEEGRTLLAFNALSSHVEDASAFYSGADRWRALLGPNAPKAIIAAAGASEAERIAKVRAETEWLSRGEIALVASPAWGFDVWYGEGSLCVLAANPATSSITIGCRDTATAERLFGEGGLKNVFPKLAPEGWGGREAVGGSPRGAALSQGEIVAAHAAVRALAEVHASDAPKVAS